jgi:AraC-like DNA-binding protein
MTFGTKFYEHIYHSLLGFIVLLYSRFWNYTNNNKGGERLDRRKASEKLSKLNLMLSIDNFDIDILWFRYMEMEGDWCIKRHTHSSVEFHIVAEGCCRVLLDEGEFEAKAGEFYITAPGVFHEQRSSTTEGHYVEYSINYDFLEVETGTTEAEVIYEILVSEGCRPVSDINNISRIFEEALEEAYNEKIGYFNNVRNSAERILILAVRALTQNKVKSSYEVATKLKNNDYRFSLIEKYIKDNLSNEITTKELAAFIYLSDKQVYRIIKEKTGKSAIKYINSLRLKRAKELLKNSDMNIKGISELLGFTSEYYFNQFFKREEGYPPGMYRVNIKNV